MEDFEENNNAKDEIKIVGKQQQVLIRLFKERRLPRRVKLAMYRTMFSMTFAVWANSILVFFKCMFNGAIILMLAIILWLGGNVFGEEDDEQ